MRKGQPGSDVTDLRPDAIARIWRYGMLFVLRADTNVPPANRSLYLSNNPISELPPDIFSSLDNLR